MKKSGYDLLILGGGCAGLSLGQALIKYKIRSFRALIIESRQTYAQDKNWCFWDKNPSRYNKIIRKSWDQWSFSTKDEGVSHHESGENLAYHCISSVDFYNQALEQINNSDCVDIITDTEIQKIEIMRSGIRAETSNGIFYSQWGVDTRPTKSKLSGGNIYGQKFEGVEIETNVDQFDHLNVSLMSNMCSDSYGFRFTYILPFSPRRAFIEETRFGKNIKPDLIKEELDASLEKIAGESITQIHFRETGFIPMSTALTSSKRNNRLILAGVSAGAARASTGYAFLRIQNWAAYCAKNIFFKGFPKTHPSDPILQKWMDQIFLRVIERSPDLASNIFLSMASGVKPDVFARFLSDRGSYIDFLKIALALPKKPFMSELLRGIVKRESSL